MSVFAIRAYVHFFADRGGIAVLFLKALAKTGMMMTTMPPEVVVLVVVEMMETKKVHVRQCYIMKFNFCLTKPAVCACVSLSIPW